MKYQKGSFVVVPNIEYLKGKNPLLLSVFFWICYHADEDGMCFPSRRKLASEVGSTVKTVDKYIKELEADGVIEKTKRKKKNSKENHSNLYQVMQLDTPPYPPETTLPRVTDDPTGSVPNDPVTILNNNYTQVTINTDQEDQTIKEEKVTLNVQNGKSPVTRLQALNGKLFKSVYGFFPSPTSFGSTGKVFKDLLVNFSEIQIACLLIVFYAWAGMDDKSENEKEFLMKNTHSIYLFRANLTKYEAYIRNIAGWSKEFDDDTLLYPIIRKRLSQQK